MNNNNGQQAMIAVQEERARIGGIEVAKKTVIAATEEGLVWLTTFIGVALPFQRRRHICSLVVKYYLCIAFYKRR